MKYNITIHETEVSVQATAELQEELERELVVAQETPVSQLQLRAIAGPPVERAKDNERA